MNKFRTIFSLVYKGYRNLVFTEKHGVLPDYQSYINKKTFYHTR
jgi:hypothetical protein